jgi:hypothetical protein
MWRIVDKRFEGFRDCPQGEEGGDREIRCCLVEDESVGEELQKGYWQTCILRSHSGTEFHDAIQKMPLPFVEVVGPGGEVGREWATGLYRATRRAVGRGGSSREYRHFKLILIGLAVASKPAVSHYSH